MALSTTQVIQRSHVAFGTSGVRGLVTDLTDDVCAAFAVNFIKVMQQNFTVDRVAVAIDNRPSSPQMAAAVAGVLKAIGVPVDFYGVIPTPALAYQAMQDKVPAIMITGSHIPFDRNGIKFYRPDGEISKADEQAILSVNTPLPLFTPVTQSVLDTAAKNYLQRYLSIYPAGILSGKHIGIYEHSSAGRELYYQVFEALGAKVTRLERSDHFVPIDTEAVSDADKQKGMQWAKQYQFDAIFSTDGDGDRPLLSDENGHWLRGDIVGLLCAQALGIDALAVPVSCNTAIEKSGVFNQVLRTRIGSPYVIAAFETLKTELSYAGFEANGGFLLGSDIIIADKTLKALPTRDALLPALAVLVSAAERPVSALLAMLPQRFTASDRIQNVPATRSQQLLDSLNANPEQSLNMLSLDTKTLLSIDNTDGLRMTFVDGDIVHLRPSGNAPELRCYCESNTEVQAVALVSQVLANAF
ncbi:phosphomannomutase [Rheinheimera maricola]|uniref:Phosphomannomutase n=1 Tax=Rheinheimera maricola TaxID=2793282 RepID=A0ABS7X6L8_9GAMM|nr:phosphomannomutase [Rheinheimera maricola]MBZ9610348.1 phosphomannomutase [Rheinheimera maricola]